MDRLSIQIYKTLLWVILLPIIIFLIGRSWQNLSTIPAIISTLILILCFTIARDVIKELEIQVSCQEIIEMLLDDFSDSDDIEDTEIEKRDIGDKKDDRRK